jgi:hypothetical protein
MSWSRSVQIPELGWWEAGKAQHKHTGHGKTKYYKKQTVYCPPHAATFIEAEVKPQK